MKSSNELLSKLRAKMRGERPTFKDTYGSPVRGVATGLNEAFVIDRATRDRLVQEDAKSADIIKPLAQGEDLKRWSTDSRDLWLIFTPRGQVDIDKYPAVKKHLLAFKDQLEKRAGDQQWFELTEEQEALEGKMKEPKISFGGTTVGECAFSLDTSGNYVGECGFFTSGVDYFLVGLLNSKPYWTLLTEHVEGRNGEYEVLAEHVEMLPIPDADGFDRADIGRISDYCHRAFQERSDVVRHFQGMTKYNLSPQGLAATLSERLQNWYVLSFPEFREEVIKCFGQDIPADDLELWEGYLNQEKDRVFHINAQLAHVEAQLNQVVYRVLGLTEEEIELMERL